MKLLELEKNRPMRVIYVLLVSLSLLVGDMSKLAADELEGRWTIALETPGGSLEFSLEVESQSGDSATHQAKILNGIERIPVQLVGAADGLTIEMPHYDSSIQLQAPKAAGEQAPAEYVGTWKKQRGGEEVAVVPCQMFRPQERKGDSADAFVGKWSVEFADSDDPAIAIFKSTDSGHVAGTFLTTTGDYRFLQGLVSQQTLTLSCFDGAHAFLFKARLLEDGSLDGDFWSGNWYHEEWKAHRDDNAVLPDGFQQVAVSDAKRLRELSFLDLNGQFAPILPDDLGAKVTLIELFGSWCPNCHDEAAYLKELDQKYRGQGLKIVGLAFELTGSQQRDLRQVQRYVERYDIDYPVFLAGTSDKSEAAKAFPVIDQVKSYPTTLFVDSSGEIRAVYSGFSGPATGQAHEELRSRFESLIEKLLAE